ncbi:MAG: Uma2 family endonuclease [Cyanobacteria bacterium P01_F01_bin.143]
MIKIIESLNIRVGKEPDGGYAFHEDKDFPDLAIEVNFSSGDISDLEKYQLIGIPEVWIWDNKNNLSFYCLNNNVYEQQQNSKYLKVLSPKIVCEFVNFMEKEDLNEGRRKIIHFLQETSDHEE